ncbi:uncharacterized protein Dvar_21110 [Desulfosarcina variabilis str. Montpellier]
MVKKTVTVIKIKSSNSKALLPGLRNPGRSAFYWENYFILCYFFHSFLRKIILSNSSTRTTTFPSTLCNFFKYSPNKKLALNLLKQIAPVLRQKKREGESE